MKRIFILIIIILLSLPVVQMAFDFPKVVRVDENRKLKEKPSFTLQNSDIYPKDLTVWFNDNFGFRDLLIKIKTQIDYSLFNSSSKVYIGKEGWLFYRSVIDVEQPLVEKYLSLNSDEVVMGVERLTRKLENRKVQLILTIAPMKNIFYDSMLPSDLSVPSIDRQINLLEKRLKKIPNLIYIDSIEILKNAMKQRPVFHKTDFHWNDPAAFEVSQGIINRLSKIEKKSPPLLNQKLQIETVELSGGEAMYMPIFFPPKEKALMVKRNWDETNNILLPNIKPFIGIVGIKKPNGNELGAMVAIGDSFLDGMIRAGLPLSFKKFYHASWNSSQLDEIIDDLPIDTKYLLIEFVEVSQQGFSILAKEAKRK